MRLDIVGRYIKSFIIQYHLDELDKELEKRGHKFVWYAGD
ncbi:hypothetical protein J2S09_004114 [Bacillus fengqiuensis]|nr:hypothetical protein [Bacillus fengqiuensis]